MVKEFTGFFPFSGNFLGQKLFQFFANAEGKFPSTAMSKATPWHIPQESWHFRKSSSKRFFHVQARIMIFFARHCEYQRFHLKLRVSWKTREVLEKISISRIWNRWNCEFFKNFSRKLTRHDGENWRLTLSSSHFCESSRRKLNVSEIWSQYDESSSSSWLDATGSATIFRCIFLCQIFVHFFSSLKI